ncbi:MAG: DUF1549 domain-containing protein, partial [Verrucomicrobia bacterium]|nr:DUF1549 domain-containing protein [Verrucomicrobiota bacterium]
MTPRAGRHSRTLAFVLSLGLVGLLGAAASKQPQPNWAFKPVTRPAVPTPKNTAWSTNAIDRFLLTQMETHGLAPGPDADPRTLIRRLSFALTGLPPKPEEVEAFVRESQIGNRQSA